MTRRDVDKLQEEIEELFADLWQVPRFSGLRHGFRPNVDCFHTDDPHALTVVVELPGVDPQSVRVVAGERLLVLVASRDSALDAPGWDDVYEVGTVALVHKMIKVPDGTLRILVQGLDRVHLDARLDTEPYLLGEFSQLPDVLEETPELE